METIEGGKPLKGGNYSRKYGIGQNSKPQELSFSTIFDKSGHSYACMLAPKNSSWWWCGTSALLMKRNDGRETPN